MVAILSDDVYKKIETTAVYCAKIVDKKTTSDLIKIVSHAYPLPNLAHLKRVKAEGNELFILVVDESCGICKPVLEAKRDLAGLTDFFIVQVPKCKPLTRAHYNAAKALWPTQFHEDKRLERALTGTLFSDAEVSLMKKFMEIASAECERVEPGLMGASGAIIVDPSLGRVVARGHTSSSHPLKHAVMACIDAVAEAQGGRAWGARGSLLQQRSVCAGGVGGVDTGRDSKSNPDDASVLAAKKHKPSLQYLCTGCAMALVHSRIGRVFYGHTNELAGGLGTHFKIHVQTDLNHHFEVFKLIN